MTDSLVWAHCESNRFQIRRHYPASWVGRHGFTCDARARSLARLEKLADDSVSISDDKLFILSASYQMDVDWFIMLILLKQICIFLDLLPKKCHLLPPTSFGKKSFKKGTKRNWD